MTEQALSALSIDTQANALANDIEAVCEGLTARQRRYLAHTVVSVTITEAAAASGVKPSTGTGLAMHDTWISRS